MSLTAYNYRPRTLVTAIFDVFDTKKCKSWLENLEFFLQQEEIDHVLTNPCPDVGFPADPGFAKWKEDDYSCRNFILQTMFNPQLCVKSCRTAKDLWDTIKTIYMAEMEHESWRVLRMNFFLRQKEVAYVLMEPCPDAPAEDQTKIAKWKQHDYSCRNLILQEVVVPQYAKYMTAKELWGTLYAHIFNKLSEEGKKEIEEFIRQRKNVGEAGKQEEKVAELEKKVIENEEEIERLKDEVANKDRQVSMLHSAIFPAWRHLDQVMRFSSALVAPTSSSRFHRTDTGTSAYESNDGNESAYENDEFNIGSWNIDKIWEDGNLVRRNPTRSDVLALKPTPINSLVDSLETRSDPGNLSLKL